VRAESIHEDDDFLDEELDFRSMLEAGLKGEGPKGAGPKGAGPKGAGPMVRSQGAGTKETRPIETGSKETGLREVGAKGAESKETGLMEVRPKEARSKEAEPQKTHVEDSSNTGSQSGYESSPYDSDDSDGIIDPKDAIYKIECPSYEDFIKSKESLNTEVKVANVGEELPEEFQGISA
jgi:hypothetical protein